MYYLLRKKWSQKIIKKIIFLEWSNSAGVWVRGRSLLGQNFFDPKLTLLTYLLSFASLSNFPIIDFLDTQVSLAPTRVRVSVGDTFGFPFNQRLWLLYMKS